MSDERTTAQGKSGVACHRCRTNYDICARAVLERYGACCPECRNTDTHDERPEPATAPRVWEIPAEPEGVDVVWTTDRDTDEPIVWERGMRRWSPVGESRRYTWTELLARGPVTEGRPAPEYRPGFYRLRGELARGTQSTVPPGALVFLARTSATWATVASASGEAGSITFDELDRAGAERVEHP